MTGFHTGRRVSPVTQPASQPGVSIPHPLHPHLPARRHTPSTSPIDGSPVKPHYCSPGIPHAIPHLLLPGRSPPSTLTRSLDDSLSRVSWPLVPPPPPSPNQSPGSIQEIRPGSWLLQARFLIRIPRYLSSPLLLIPLPRSPQSCSLASVFITMGSADNLQ